MTTSPARLDEPRLHIATIVIVVALTIFSAAASPALADNDRHRGNGRNSHGRHGHGRYRQPPHVYYAPAPNHYYAPRRYHYAPPPVVYYPRPPSGVELFFGLR